MCSAAGLLSSYCLQGDKYSAFLSEMNKSSGLLVCWSTGLLVCWSAGLPGCRARKRICGKKI